MVNLFDNNDELFPVVDEDGNIVGTATRGECHGGSKLLHPVVHLHVFDGKGNLFLQKRPEWKDIQPGKWDTSVGGHVDLGEDVSSALKREVSEELGIEEFVPEFIVSYVFESDRERELVLCTKPFMMVRFCLLQNWMAVGSGRVKRLFQTLAQMFLLQISSRNIVVFSLKNEIIPFC